MKVLILFIGLLVGNFVAESLTVDPVYFNAFEHSYFEGVALFSYWILERFVWND